MLLLEKYFQNCQACFGCSELNGLNTFENKFEFNHKFKKYLKESCELDIDQPFTFNYFLKNSFVMEIPPK